MTPTVGTVWKSTGSHDFYVRILAVTRVDGQKIITYQWGVTLPEAKIFNRNKLNATEESIFTTNYAPYVPEFKVGDVVEYPSSGGRYVVSGTIDGIRLLKLEDDRGRLESIRMVDPHQPFLIGRMEDF